MAEAPKPFEIAIPEERLADMRCRLKATSWPDDWGNDDWDYCVELGWLQDMVRYWADEFDWRGQEALMNRWSHFRAEVDGFPLHFVHMRGKGPNPIPLILTHGWPWTFWDYKDVVGPLVDPAAHGLDPAISFDVVVPSLPGFTFSTPLRSNEVTIRRIARLWVTLMRDVLGYDRFAAAGGDWGALVTGELGHAHAAHVLGTLQPVPIVPGFDLWAIRDEDFAPDEAWMPARQREAAPLILPHVTVHSSDPQTLAYALADSPVGTAAWMWERRRNWSDCDGDVVGVFGRDFLCATASLYWLTNSIGSSLRIYKDHFGIDWKPLDDALPVMRAPAAVMISPKELVMVPRAEAERTMNLKRWTTMPKGGHFAVSERPEGFVGEVRAFFGELATAGPQ